MLKFILTLLLTLFIIMQLVSCKSTNILTSNQRMRINERRSLQKLKSKANLIVIPWEAIAHGVMELTKEGIIQMLEYQGQEYKLSTVKKTLSLYKGMQKVFRDTKCYQTCGNGLKIDTNPGLIEIEDVSKTRDEVSKVWVPGTVLSSIDYDFIKKYVASKWTGKGDAEFAWTIVSRSGYVTGQDGFKIRLITAAYTRFTISPENYLSGCVIDLDLSVNYADRQSFPGYEKRLESIKTWIKGKISVGITDSGGHFAIELHPDMAISNVPGVPQTSLFIFAARLVQEADDAVLKKIVERKAEAKYWSMIEDDEIPDELYTEIEHDESGTISLTLDDYLKSVKK